MSRVARTTLRRLRKGARAVAAVAMATLREIFDESAYSRYLAGRGLTSSPENYAAFLHDNSARNERRPRCC